MATNSEPSFEDYRLIAEGSYDWDSWIRPDESLQWTSKAGMAISGYSPAECRAMRRFPWPLVAKDDHVTFELFDHLVGEHRPGNDLPVRFVRKDGSMIWVTVSWQPLYDGTREYQGVRLSVSGSQLEPAQSLSGPLSARGHRAFWPRSCQRRAPVTCSASIT